MYAELKSSKSFLALHLICAFIPFSYIAPTVSLYLRSSDQDFVEIFNARAVLYASPIRLFSYFNKHVKRKLKKDFFSPACIAVDG